ncbi:MAG: NAD(P)H-hydrate dehydratase [Alphaproteobacteria bacterium]|nr:NAD(P)H-hydrate dehydratase [Alphaproteobacteria bacterium]MBU1521743.1 NAD(P)H-hydrate dehydratase [Alphaproteobacteria bacterium]MBU2030379.1 NAD(P)H-hydrate dehydratase [Alphaproteobacteria bacterium]MBU2166130.1 NAD(P)H-hydrate dehydratase [Alphaproteobacteria bacterium]MBU2231033.1 NAD(P)H-hydrate dehydratase [Alphaproteobacteria bacterium]
MIETNDPAIWRNFLPWPGAETHKHARGRLGVVSGRAHQTGAARLAARAGLRIGAGVVRIYCPPDAVAVIAPAIEAVMLTPFASAEALAREVEEMDAVVVGPAAGLDEATVANIQALASSGAALVIDADGLSVFKGRSAELFALLDRDDVLTPHEGEFERLFPGLLHRGRAAAAAEAAERAQAVVVLKGAETVIAAPDGRLRINRNGSPWLATAGTGDVLSGMIGGLMAQRMDSFDAACAAVWIHADAADRFGPGLIAEDLSETSPVSLRALWMADRQG